MGLPNRSAATYLAPLREGGSLPAIVADSEDDLWVVKFRGAGQGPKSLVAELIVGGLAKAIGLPVPELGIVHLDEAFGQGERDPEIRDVLKASAGANVGLRYLDGAFNLDLVAAEDLVDPLMAAKMVWLDTLCINPDRMARNPNLMVYNEALWLIDHGAALFDHHDWSRVTREKSRRVFAPISEHILLGKAASIEVADQECAPLATSEVLDEILSAIPDSLLEESAFGSTPGVDAETNRAHYRRWFEARLDAPREWVAQAERARADAAPPERLKARR